MKLVLKISENYKIKTLIARKHDFEGTQRNINI